jgi:hypothetical protein
VLSVERQRTRTRPVRGLQFASSVSHHGAMDKIKPLLLYELRPIQQSPAQLQISLRGWGYEVSSDAIVECLRRLRDEGLVDGPGISLIHSLPVWLTRNGRARADDSLDLGEWRRVGAIGRDS